MQMPDATTLATPSPRLLPAVRYSPALLKLISTL
jgi:hypothetical protein